MFLLASMCYLNGNIYVITLKETSCKLTILYQILFQDQRDCNTTLRDKINIHNSQIQLPS